MTYAVANLHGCYEAFKKLLEKINFGDKDILFVVGDTVDYGDEPMELLCDMSVRCNVYPVIGEHDRTAFKMLKGFDEMLKSGESPDADYIGEMNAWIADGGKPTLDGFRKLDDDMKEGVLDYLADFAPYETAECNGKEYVMVHAGIRNFSPERDLDSYDESDFIEEPLDLTRNYFPNASIIVGHVATYDIDGAKEGRIYHPGNNYAIDCAVVFDGHLGCLCLETGEEYYV